MDASTFDPKAFRQALGSFATGVTIITTRDKNGEPLGLTANSFNSVSLDPPMVLWSLAKNAYSLPVFRESENWAVHILSSHQADLSSRFAMRGEDKFAGIDVEEGIGSTPLLKDCMARFQCKTAFQYEGGDHVIFVGEVVDFEHTDTAPLVFHGGRYARATHRSDRDDHPRRPFLGGSFTDNFLGYLLGRGHFKFYSQIRPLLLAENLSDEEFYMLATLTLKHDMNAAQIRAAMTDVLDDACNDALDSLIQRGYVQREGSASSDAATYQLTKAGSDCALKLISAAKAVEAQVTERLGEEEATVLKSLLNRLLDTIDPGAAELWEGEEQAQDKQQA
ncbi:MAG: flavin reductase [Nevskiales bacterium]